VRLFRVSEDYRVRPARSFCQWLIITHAWSHKAQAILDDQADLCVPVANGLTSWEEIADLGELVAGRRTGRRRSSNDITVFKQNGDQGMDFMALAKLAREKAHAAGLGLEI
jgi:ornithine cyclodeaminase/alanine dehydrogenase-like protein (mu-crystallin family)